MQPRCNAGNGGGFSLDCLEQSDASSGEQPRQVGRIFKGDDVRFRNRCSAIGLLRDVRRKPLADAYVSLSAADPLNLIGILTPGPRLASLAGNRLLFRDGLPVATLAAGEIRYLEELPPKEQWEAQLALLRRYVPVVLDELELPPAT